MSEDNNSIKSSQNNENNNRERNNETLRRDNRTYSNICEFKADTDKLRKGGEIPPKTKPKDNK